jgi:hypothetical protein
VVVDINNLCYGYDSKVKSAAKDGTDLASSGLTIQTIFRPTVKHNTNLCLVKKENNHSEEYLLQHDYAAQRIVAKSIEQKCHIEGKEEERVKIQKNRSSRKSYCCKLCR